MTFRLHVFLNSSRYRVLTGIAALILGVSLPTGFSYALSELQPGQQAPADGNTVPIPDPIKPPTDPQEPAAQEPPAEGEDVAPEDDQAEQPPVQIDEQKANIARPEVDPDGPLPEVQYDLTKLPEPVQRMRQLLVDVAISGDIEKIRPLAGTDSRAALLSLTEATPDPVAYLKSQSGDEEGREILAILEEVLNAGYVHLNVGTPEEIYAWPYFFGMPLDRLTPRQKVELFKVITGGEYEEMRQYGAYLFYRVGITPSGDWAFFVSGE